MDLYLIRHARPAVAEGLCYGRTDLDTLEPASEVAPRVLARLPARFRLHASPLRRCAALAAELDRDPRLDGRLREIDFGAWEMRPWRELGADALERWQAEGYGAGLHGGEAYADLRGRVLEWFAEQPMEDPPLAAVTHAGVIRVLLAELAGLGRDASLAYPVPYAGVLHLRRDGGRWSIRS